MRGSHVLVAFVTPAGLNGRNARDALRGKVDAYHVPDVVVPVASLDKAFDRKLQQKVLDQVVRVGDPACMPCFKPLVGATSESSLCTHLTKELQRAQ